MKFLSFFALIICLLPVTATAQPIKVVTTIVPISALVKQIAGDTVQVVQMVPAGQSVHGFRLKPSHMQVLQDADIVLSIDPSFETFLYKAQHVIADSAQHVVLSQVPDMYLLPSSENPDVPDVHIWLHVPNLIHMVEAIEAILSDRQPRYRPVYVSNAQRLVNRLRRLDDALQGKLHPLQNKPFIVYHDAYRYITQHYGLTQMAALTSTPDVPLSAREVMAARKLIAQRNIPCLLHETSVSPRMLDTLKQNTPIRMVAIDPLGTAQESQPIGLMHTIADAFVRCLK